jgi:beta-galactosidase
MIKAITITAKGHFTLPNGTRPGLIGGAPNTIPYLPKIMQANLDSVLSAGISINMYMFHGGTTRGFMNGANYDETHPYEPQISSYDYDAPLG